MFNYHKYGFLDAKKLARLTENESIWLCQFDPVWIFVNSDVYKPEIAFTEEFVILRYNEPSMGMCYYPPLGEGDLRWLMYTLPEEAAECDSPFQLAVCDESQKMRLSKYASLVECERFSSYIYKTDTLIFYNEKPLKMKKKRMASFTSDHPDAFYRTVKKEDFPAILEFVGDCNTENKTDQMVIYKDMNRLKKLMDHLYEFDMVSVLILNEERLFGFAVGTVFGNVCNVHALYARDSDTGAMENLLSAFARKCYSKCGYVSLGYDDNDSRKREMLESYLPYRVEKFYSTFNI